MMMIMMAPCWLMDVNVIGGITSRWFFKVPSIRVCFFLSR